MAFGGIAAVFESDGQIPLVHWHSCLDMDGASMDGEGLWKDALEGKPRPTQDKGYFKDVSEKVNIKHAYHEEDPDRTLLEQWVRIDDGDGKFLAVLKNNNELLVIAGKYFGYANQKDRIYVSGSIENCQYDKKECWKIESSALNSDLNGTVLELSGGDWKVLDGSTLPLDTIHCLMQQ